jgi:penicillin-binding protein 1C
MLQDYSVNQFYEKLQQLKLRNVNRQPSNYGLSLILGGAESNLWDLCKAYAYMSSTLTYFNQNDAKYRKNEMQNLNYDANFQPDFGHDESSSFSSFLISSGSKKLCLL